MAIGRSVTTILHVAVALSLAIPLRGAWAKERCSLDQEIAAESSAGTLRNWAEVYSSFERFGHCDDGAIADGYSESISKILGLTELCAQLARLHGQSDDAAVASAFARLRKRLYLIRF
jgi:hypothetical protein